MMAKGKAASAESGWRCNIWQGDFPTHNDLSDGYLTTAPVRTYLPNGYGLWQTVGNVWEWCSDWFNPRTYEFDARRGRVSDPIGPAFGISRVMRGGSYLCHDSYCNRYRNAARTSNTPDSSMANTGFRTVAAP
jgi:formylglycine-generating enzyme required for sulfatase activity